MKPYYLTTAIAYPNGRPHIGHAYEAVATDAIARFHRWMGREVVFLTGTDEHGLKMAQAARAAGVSPQALADENSGHFRALDEALNISHDHFVRTTAPAHHAASQAIWQAMAARGDLYRDRYEGWYSVRDEAFYDEAELTPAPDGGEGFRSPQGTPVEWTVEDSWFFRLSAYQDRLLAHYEAHPGFIRPEARLNEVLSFVRGGLRDLSISRASFDWGVKVPGQPDHVMYVWVDALTAYLSGIGYPGDASAWPADLHVVGKDIVRFHAVYWPAFLMSASLPLPGQVFGHGFVLHRGEKMGKSAGNAVDPFALVATYGADPLRYFLLREIVFGQDGSYSHETIVARANAELANSFGNLAQRVLSMLHKNLAGEVPPAGDTPEDAALLETVRAACADAFPAQMAELRLAQALEEWLRAVVACNQYTDTAAPWTLAKTDPPRMAAVLGTLFAAVRMLAITIAPIVPASAARLLDALGVPAAERGHAALADPTWHARLIGTGFRLAAPSPIFPRLDPAREPA